MHTLHIPHMPHMHTHATHTCYTYTRHSCHTYMHTCHTYTHHTYTLMPHMHSHTLHTLESAPAELGMPSSFPTIQYSLYHNMQRNTLSVHLQQIYNLPAGNQKKSIDSFVSLYLLPHKEEEFESRVILKTLNPFFGQEFEFARQPSLELMKKQVLVFKVFENSRLVCFTQVLNLRHWAKA